MTLEKNMKLKSIILAAIVIVVSQIAVMAQVDPSSTFSASSYATCNGAGGVNVYVRADIYWTMTVYREYVLTTVSGNYTTSAASATNTGWTNGTHLLNGSNRWSEWDKMWIGTNSSGEFATQHYIEFDCTGKSAGAAAEVYICNDFIGNDPYLCPPASGSSGPTSDSNGPVQFTDGRLNAYDVAAPVVVYPWEQATGLGVAIYSPQGAALLFVSAAELGECPSENTLIAANESAQVWVYRLSSCDYQIRATQTNGKTYVLHFTSIGSSVEYRSHEIE